MTKCDFCKCKAMYDGKTIKGPWAYMCKEHFDLWGLKTKGLYTELKDDNNNGRP